MKKDAFTLIELLVAGTIGAIVTALLVGIILACVLIPKGCQKVQEDGLKGIATQVWEGTNQPQPSINEQTTE